MKNRIVFSLFVAALVLVPALSRAGETRWEVLHVYTLANGQAVAVAVPSEWQELSKTRALETGSAARFLDESGRQVEISAAALERASETKSMARPEERMKTALATR
jgi:hypothetical protein